MEVGIESVRAHAPRIFVVRNSKEWLRPQCRVIGRRKKGPTLGCLSVVWVEAKWDIRLEGDYEFWIPRAGFGVVGSFNVL